MAQPTKSLIFGDFRLEMREQPGSRLAIRLTLWRGKEQIHVEPKQLELLAYLADEHPGENVTAQQIYEGLWPHKRDLGGNVQQHISKLRGILHDDKTKPRYIQTLSNDEGYCFIAPVKVQGDLGRLTGSVQWSPAKYFDMLSRVEHSDGDPEDIRIFTVGFPGFTQFQLDALLIRGVNISIIISNPSPWATSTGYATAREDKEPQPLTYYDHLRELVAQNYPGKLEWRDSKRMPPGFITHTKDWAILGLLLSQRSYLSGPMIEISSNTTTWETLLKEWRYFWEYATND